MSFVLLGILNSQVAAAGDAAYDWLETTLISSNTASVTFSSLGSYSSYKHLQIRLTYRSNQSTSPDNLFMYFNADQVSNYSQHALFGDGSTVTSNSGFNNTSIGLGTMPAVGATTNAFAAGICDILDFGSTTKNKTIRILRGHSAGSGNTEIGLRSGLYVSTNAITSITLKPGGTNSFISGCRFSLYGVK